MKYAVKFVKALMVCCVWLLLGHAPAGAKAQSLPAGRADVPAASQLVGTIKSSRFSGVVFDDGSGNQSFYRLHDSLPDGTKIIRIGSESIKVKRTDGEIDEIFITGGKQSVRTNPVRQYRTTPRRATKNTSIPRKRKRNR